MLGLITQGVFLVYFLLATLVNVSYLVLVILLVYLKYLFACLVAIHDRHVDIQDNDIKVFWLYLIFASMILLSELITAEAIFLYPLQIFVKLSHVVLDSSDSQVTIDGSHCVYMFELCHCFLHNHQLKWLIVNYQILLVAYRFS